MKRLYNWILVASILSLAAACGGNNVVEPASDIPAVITATFSNLEKVGVNPGSVVELPVKATSADGLEMSLSFFSDRVYLPAGTYTVGTGVNQYKGHVRNSQVEGDIVAGMLTVTVANEEEYAISGTVRLDNPDKTAVKIRAKGNLAYEFPSEYYYTVTKGVTVSGFKADVYKVFTMDEPYQVAEFSVVGGETGTFPIDGTGKTGTAIFGTAVDGSWVYEDGIGWHNLQHGSVTISDVRGKKTFEVDDTYSASFANCEKKDAITPKPRSGDDSWVAGNSWVEKSLTSKVFSVPSPVAKNMYEFTVRIYFPDGREFLSCTFLSPSEYPFSNGRQTVGPVDIADYPSVSELKAMRNTCYFVVDGVRQGPGDTPYFQLYDKTQGDIMIVGVYLFMDTSNTLYAPFSQFLGRAASKAFGFRHVE